MRLDEQGAWHALDELFTDAERYRSADEYMSLMAFIRRFRQYSAFNAMLVHTQMAGARFVAPASRWRQVYGRRIRVEARPLVILQEGGYHRPSLGENARAWLRGAEGRSFDPLPAAGFTDGGSVV